MCDSMPILDEDFNFSDINLDFLESPPRPKPTEECSTQNQNLPKSLLGSLNVYSNEGRNLTDTQPSLQNDSSQNSMKELAKRVAEVDTLVCHIRKVEKERDDLRKQLQDFHQSAKEVQSLYANEKQKRIEEEAITRELSQRCSLLDTDLTAKTLEVDQLQAQLESLKGPIEYDDLAVRYLRLFQQHDNERPLHWHDQAVFKDLYKYCKEKCLKVQPITQRSPRKRKAATLKIDAEVQCDILDDSLNKECKELRDQTTQCVAKTRDQGCQHIGTTTTRSTTTSCFFKYHDVGVNCNIWDMKYVLNEMLSDVRTWSTSVAPLSPITDLNTGSIEATKDVTLPSVSILETTELPPPPHRVEFRTVGTCTDVCNVQRNVDFVSQLPKIKRSTSRPPSSLIFEPVKNENTTISTPPSPLPLNAFNQQLPPLPPLPQMFPTAFDELWQIFGHMLYGLLHRRNVGGVSLADQNIMPSNIPNQQEFYNWLQTLNYNIPTGEGIHTQRREASAIRQENSNREEGSSTTDGLLDHQSSECNLASPLNFSSVAPEKCTSSGQQILKPKAQKSSGNTNDEIPVTNCVERQSVGTSPIRCIASSPVCKEANNYVHSNIYPLNESITKGIIEINSDSRTPSAFTSPNSNKEPKVGPKFSNEVDETAKQILELFPSTNDRSSALQSVQKLLQKNWKCLRRKAREHRKRKKITHSSSESGSETAVDFIAKLTCFGEKPNVSSSNNDNGEDDSTEDFINTRPRKSGVANRKETKRKNAKNLRKIHRSLFGSDSESSEDDLEKELQTSISDEKEDSKEKNVNIKFLDNVNCIQEPFLDSSSFFHNIGNSNSKPSCKVSQQDIETKDINEIPSENLQIEVQSKVPICTATKTFYKASSNSSSPSELSQRKSYTDNSGSTKESSQNRIQNPLIFTEETMPNSSENKNENSEFQNSTFNNFKNGFYSFHKRNCIESITNSLTKEDKNCIQAKNSVITDISSNMNKNNNFLQEERIRSNLRKETSNKEKSKHDECAELDKETKQTNVYNTYETEELPSLKMDSNQNLFYSPKVTKEKTLINLQNLSPLSDTSSTSSTETRLVIVSDTEEIADCEPTPSTATAKKRGRKRKSESSSSSSSNFLLATYTAPYKRSQRLLAKQKIKECQMADQKSSLLPVLRKDSNQNNGVSENGLVKENRRNSESASVPEILKFDTAKITIIPQQAEQTQESQKERREATQSQSYACSEAEDEIMKIDSTKSISRTTCISPPASPTPLESNSEVDWKPVKEIPLELNTNYRCSKRRSKSLLHNLIDNYGASKYRSFNQTHLKPQEETLISRLTLHLKEYFALSTKDEGSALKLVDLLLATSKDPKIIAHAACVSSQELSRPVPISYENLKNLSAPLLNNPAPSSIYTNMTDIMRQLLDKQPEFKEVLLGVIESKLFNVQSADTLALDAALNLTDLYLLTLSLQLPSQRENPARLFIAKCLYFHRMKAAPMIYAVLCAFPTTLPHREERNYDRSDPLITVIQHILMCTNYNMDNHELFHRELLSKLRYVYHFEIYKPDFQDVVQNLVSKLQVGKIDNLKYSFAVFCKRLPPERVVRDIIQVHFIPLSNEYYNHLQHSTDYDVRTAALLDCFSSVVKPFPRDSSSPIAAEINNYMNIFKRFLSIIDRPIVQEAALHAILRLQRFSNINCYKALANFKHNYELSPYTRAALKTFIHRKPLNFWKDLLTQSA